jgi:peptidoglycan/LPS O-acetylase OafA/YrhL
MKSRENQGHSELSFIDGIRGLLALWVLLGHATVYSGSTLYHYFNGAPAVDIFMLLSGLLMGWNSLKRQEVEPIEKPRTWLYFYIRRFFRIAPLFYLCFVIAFVFANSYSEMGHAIQAAIAPPWSGQPIYLHQKEAPTAINFILHLFFLFGFHPEYAANNALPDWSIGLEMQFYLAFPFMMMFLRRFSLVRFVSVSTVLYIAALLLIGVYITAKPKLLGSYPQPSMFLLKINCFVVGMLIAHAFSAAKEVNYVALLLALMLCFIKQNLQFSVGTCLIVFLLLYNFTDNPLGGARRLTGVINGLLSGRFFSWMGRISYSVYLIHTLLMIPIACFLLKYKVYLSLPPALRFCVLSVLILPLVYTLSHVLERYIERPGIGLGRVLIQRLKSR